MRFTKLTALFALALLLFAGAATALTVPPAPSGRLSDYAGMFSREDAARINARLKAIEDATSNQIAVAVFKSLDGDSLEDFSIRLFDKWKIGQKGKDNGIILLFFTDDRKIRIEVGKGLEGVVTDALSGQIIRSIIAPKFRVGAYAEGLMEAVDALDKASRGEFKADPKRSGTDPKEGQAIGFIVAIFIFILVSAIANRNRSSSIGSRRHSNFIWFGPGGFGGGGFGGGGGGFGGGGGGGGGGGASGGW